MPQPRTPETGLEPVFKAGLEHSLIARAVGFASRRDDELADELRFVVVRELTDQGLLQQAKALIENMSYVDQQLRSMICIGAAEGADSPLWPEIQARMAKEEQDLFDLDLVREEYVDARSAAEVRAGNIQGALKIVQEANNAAVRCLIVTLIAEGHEAAAFEAAKNMSNSNSGYGQIAAELARAGQIDRAVQILRSIKPFGYDVATVVEILAKKDIKGARKLVEDLGMDPADFARFLPPFSIKAKVLELAGIMPPVVAAERIKKALGQDNIRKALKIARSVVTVSAKQERQRFSLVELQLAKYLATQGEYQAAIDWLQGADDDQQLEAQLAIASAQGPTSELWDRVAERIETIEDEDDLFDNYQRLINEAQAMPVSSDIVPAGIEDISRFNTRQLKLIGASAYRNWQSFAGQDTATFVRLANGVAPVAAVFMPKEDQRQFTRYLMGELRQLDPDAPGYRVMLRHLSEALVKLDDGGAVSELLRMYANTDTTTGMRILKTLLEHRNTAAGTAGIKLLCDPDLPDNLYNYLLQKLASTGFIDEDLPAEIKRCDTENWPAWASRKLMQQLHQELNLQMDSYILVWFTQKIDEILPNTLITYPRDDAERLLNECLMVVIGKAKEAKQRLETYSQGTLLRVLHSSPDDLMLYFLFYGGKSDFAAVPRFDSYTFEHAIERAYTIQQRIIPSAVSERLWDSAPAGWYQAMRERRRPDPSLVWQVDVGATAQELRHTACQRMQSVLGTELSWLLSAGLNGESPDSFSAMPQDTLPLESTLAVRLQKLLGPTIGKVVAGEALAIPVSEFEKIKRKMISQARQMADSPNHADNAEHWRRMAQELAAGDSWAALGQLVPFILRQPAMQPSGAIVEWSSHIAGMAADLYQAQQLGPDKRQLTLRYLDGKEDFVEMTRFADGATCCFTTQVGTDEGQDPEYGWRMRIARDPHWFVFTIEDTPPDAPRRHVSGFVFGSLGFVDDKPAVLLNGVYMWRKTNAAANAILDQIIVRFAKPLGVKTVAVAAKHGGAFDLDSAKWQNGADRTMFRPRAIKENDIFDDIGRKVNDSEQMGHHMWVRDIA